VIAVAPRLEDGSPFPTALWLTCPRLVALVSERESAGAAARWGAQLRSDAGLAGRARSADAAYRAFRGSLSDGPDPCAAVGLAGQADPLAVKCLHARVAAALGGIDDPVGIGILREPEAGGVPASCDDARCVGLRIAADAPASSGAVESGSHAFAPTPSGRDDHMATPTVRKAAIDIGTVTTRLLVADVSGRDVSEVLRRTVVTHLGEGLHATGGLSDVAIGRVVDAVAGFMRDVAETGATEVTVVATSAARDASNGREFVQRLERAGARPRIIAGATEANLSFVGATSSMDGDDVLVADLGGGSTELVFGSVHETEGGRSVAIEAARSIDVGSRRVLDMFLHSDPPTREELAAAGGWVADELRPFLAALPERPRTLVTLAGTGTTLSAIHQRLAVYDPAKVHGSRLSGGDIADLREELAALPLARRREVVGMDPARADVIVAGALILETLLALAGLDSTIVSEHDILYGLVLEGV
jgi:exopolyphosphatase/guanosine-5'-triphosphate,3'-diphosphate pyrophosphatase